MVIRLLLLLLVCLGLHAGYQFAAPVINNSMLEGKMKTMIRDRGRRGENDLRRDLLAYAREKNLPLHEGNIFIQVNNQTVTLAAVYEKDVDLFGIKRHYVFNPASEPGAKVKPRSARARAATR